MVSVGGIHLLSVQLRQPFFERKGGDFFSGSIEKSLRVSAAGAQARKTLLKDPVQEKRVGVTFSIAGGCI
jgi:hypothetical protein